MNRKNRVVVGMSGGVDSSTAAAILVSQGYEVIGVMLKLWNDIDSGMTNRCCSPDSMTRARQVCMRLGIPFFVIDAKEIFFKKVVEFFVQGYQNSITPNPCLECNLYIRWGFLMSQLENMDADYFATGHYGIIRGGKRSRFELLRGYDYAKDQSYVLYVLDQKKLSKTILPLGTYKKFEVRQLAAEFSLPVAERKDSQDLCFLGNRDYREFLPRYNPDSFKPGEIMDSSGNVLGTHQGLPFYTIGQRKSLGITSNIPQYVISKNPAMNQIIVGNNAMRERNELTAGRVNWISGLEPVLPFRAQIKIRYKSNLERGIVYPMTENRFQVKFDRPVKDITPGQAAVIYNNDVCLGGGIIIQ